MERIVQAEPLGGRKPSELLASMMEFCPRGEERSAFMAYHFLNRLPSELRVLLAEDDHQDLRALAARADKLVAHQQQRAVVATVAQPEPTVNAVRQQKSSRGHGGGRGRGGRGGGQQYQHQQAGGQQQSGGGQQVAAPNSVARSASGLCWYHWSYGEKANHCEKHCAWQGN
jgi:hypothetical protein